MDSTDARKERGRARKWWAALRNDERWDLGDQLVLGAFDWHDWFEKKPSRAFMDEVDQERMFWEESRSTGYTPNRQRYQCTACKRWWGWEQLQPIGFLPDFDLELANCPCGGTLSRSMLEAPHCGASR